MRITAFISGNLAAETMKILLRRLAELECHEILVISDGYYPGVCVPRPKVIDPFDQASIGGALAGRDLLITSIRSPGACERRIIRTANDLNVRSLVVLADLGSGAQKFRDLEGTTIPTSIAVSDQFTSALLESQGIPAKILAPIGSPYLDHISASAFFTPEFTEFTDFPTKLALLSVPNVLDFATWKTPCLYTEDQVARDCMELVPDGSERLLDIRLHPKEAGYPPTFTVPRGRRIRKTNATPKSPITDFVLSQHAIISTYSTGLLVSSLLGVKSISYQPTPLAAVREGFYRHIGLPIARNVHQLQQCMTTSVESGVSDALRASLYNYGTSTDRLIEHIEQL